MKTTKRRTAATLMISLAIVGVLALAGCVPAEKPAPKPTASSTPTPTPVSTTAPPPASEKEAIAAAEDVLTRWLTELAKIGSADGTDTTTLEALSTANALDTVVAYSKSLTEGPLLNEDTENVEGPSTTTGVISYEKVAAYASEREGTPFGFVTINACQDASKYFITTADGKPARRPDSSRNMFDFQITYSSERQAWLVFDQIDLGTTC